MATFTEDFTRMRQEFDDSFQERKEFVQGIIDNEVEDCKMRKEFVADLTAGGDIFRAGTPGVTGR